MGFSNIIQGTQSQYQTLSISDIIGNTIRVTGIIAGHQIIQYQMLSNIQHPILSNTIIRVMENHCRTLLQTRQQFQILESRLPTRPPVTLSPSTSRFSWIFISHSTKSSQRATNLSSSSQSSWMRLSIWPSANLSPWTSRSLSSWKFNITLEFSLGASPSL